MTLVNFPTPLPKGTPRQRAAARANANSGLYETFLAPRKRQLFGDLQGNVLEIGAGAGVNLQYFPADVHWTGIEPNPAAARYILKEIRRLGKPVENFVIDAGDPRGLRLTAPDASQDAVVCTLVLCSVSDPAAMLKEIVRVLKPGGRFAFIEHVAATQGTGLRLFQDLIKPLSIALEDGCRPNRETWKTITDAGFIRVEMDHFDLHSGVLPVPFIAGTALKASPMLVRSHHTTVIAGRLRSRS